MPSHADRVRRNYDSPASRVSDPRQRLLGELKACVGLLEADTDAPELMAGLDAVAVAVTADEGITLLDALDDHVSRLTEGSTRTLMKRALDAFRAVDARKAS